MPRTAATPPSGLNLFVILGPTRLMPIPALALPAPAPAVSIFMLKN